MNNTLDLIRELDLIKLVYVKRCTKCGNVKLLSHFHNNKLSKDGKNCWCKDCIKNYHLSNRYFLLIKSRIYEIKNRDKRIAYRKNNADGIREKNKRYKIRKNKEGSGFKICRNISKGIAKSLQYGKSGLHWERMVGYTSNALMKHLEKLFTDGMSWDNYGKEGWHIDHIIPKSSFHITSYDCAEFKECWSLDNLRPMWATTRIINGIEYLGNLNKGNKIIKEIKRKIA